MWEHRSVSNKQFQESKRMTPAETYVRLMDVVEGEVTRAQSLAFEHEEFLKFIPTRGPWEP
jgi:hypothetical protein